MISENVCFSGGADGADILFGQCAEAAQHKVVHYSFKEHQTKVKNAFVLSEFLLIQSDPYLFAANKFVRRKFPTRRLVVDNLLRRNYYQIEASDRIYAVCPIGERGIPVGGTAWAVVMGALKGIKDIYVFNDAADVRGQHSWHRFCGLDENKKQMRWEMKIRPPYPSGKYTGIGSREISSQGIEAVKNLYK